MPALAAAQAIDMITLATSPNQPDAPNPARTPWFHLDYHGRRVGDPER
jgi:hypothetical protein